MCCSKSFLRLALFFYSTLALSAMAQDVPALVWITNSSVKVEQLIGDVDWATGSNTVSHTITRYNIEGTDLGCSFTNGTNLIFLFGDTIGLNTNYQAADAMALTATADGETGLLLNFYTNSGGSNVFVAPPGISMAGDDTPNAGITISNTIYIVCNTGSSTNLINPDASNYSVLVTFNPTNLIFRTNRTISVYSNGGHFIVDDLHLFGSNVLMYGEGTYRASDVYLAMTPASSFLSGAGTIYFTGLSNGQPTWSSLETDAQPVVQDIPTNAPSVGNMSVIYSTNLGLWLMTYDGGRNSPPPTNTAGIYFCYAPQPWGPWSAPQLIYNATRDHGFGVFIHNKNDDPPGPIGPTINPQANNPTNVIGGTYAPYLIEPFTRISNSTLYIYYVMSTWNPYTVVKMKSAFAITPVIDPGSLIHKKDKFSFSWTGPPNATYQVDYSDSSPPAWNTFSNLITSTNSTFNFTNLDLSNGLPPQRYYRLHTPP